MAGVQALGRHPHGGASKHAAMRILKKRAAAGGKALRQPPGRGRSAGGSAGLKCRRGRHGPPCPACPARRMDGTRPPTAQVYQSPTQRLRFVVPSGRP